LLALPDTQEDLIRRYTLNESDMAVVRQRRGAANRLGFAVQLCYLRFPGVPLGVAEQPFEPLLQLVAAQLKIAPEAWAEYGDRGQTRREHMVELQTVFGFEPFTVGHHRPALTTGTNIPLQIMEPFSPQQVPVISALARNYAICDEWFCSVPGETWPNRSFVHAGTSNGNVLNGNPPHPDHWDVETIFNVLEKLGVPWRVYCDTTLTPSLTGLMFQSLWPFMLGPLSHDHFAHFDDFISDCRNGTLPRYSFLEPSFLKNPNDQHPPHDVIPGETFLWDIWQAVSSSPAWEKTLLLITYDEHGGTYDHVMPPWNAIAPDEKSNPGEQGFYFHRFGIRVPMIAVSPLISPGTVFRSDSPTGIPYDHTSILATLRDWLQIPEDKMLPSARVKVAPTLAQLLTLREARSVTPVIARPGATPKPTLDAKPLNNLQASLVSASAVQQGKDPKAELNRMTTRQHAIDFFDKQGGHNRPRN